MKPKIRIDKCGCKWIKTTLIGIPVWKEHGMCKVHTKAFKKLYGALRKETNK